MGRRLVQQALPLWALPEQPLLRAEQGAAAEVPVPVVLPVWRRKPAREEQMRPVQATDMQARMRWS
jgi:hypothetical protein